MARVTKINVGGTNYDIAHEGELKNSGFEVVSALPTTGLFAGREVFHDKILQPYIWNGHDWITNYKTYKIVTQAIISQQGWYDIGYYTDTTQGSNAFWQTEFHGTLRIITGYNLDRPLSLVLSISGGFDQLCMTQLSSCIGYGIIPKIRVVYNSELKRRILQFYYSANRRNSVSIDYTDNSHYPTTFFMPLYAKSDVNYEGNAIIKEFTLTNGVKTNYNVEGARIIKTGGTATQMLMADGSTKEISGFAAPGDIPEKLPNPNPIIIKTADGVSVRYDGSTSGGVILEAGDNAEVTATQDSDDTMTVKFGAVVPQTLPNPNALNITVLDSEGALLGPSMVYDGVAAKYFKLIEGYGIRLSNSNLSNSNSHEVTINLKQIAGTTLLGNANGTIGIPQAVTMTQLRTMLGSLTLNDIDVTLGGNNSYTLPCFISVGGTLYQARIENNWLQIYRNGVWANLYYLSSNPPTECRYITDLSDPSWYDESVTEYELDNSATTQLLSANGSTNLANWLEAINAQQITFNSSLILSKDYNKGALDNIISNLKSKGYSVFVENDIDTILSSGNDWVISIKIKRFNDTYKAIIECYVAR